MKRWWLPSQKGTELWPRQTVAPPKLVVEGVRTGTPLYRVVAAHFAGQMKSFHTKAQQLYALSPLEVMKFRRDFGNGARAVYANIHGQEILTLEVDHRVLDHLNEVAEGFWDYALIEIYVPDMHHAGSLRAYAHLTSPVEQRLTSADVWPVDGVAANLLTKSTPDRIINASESDDFVRSAAGGAENYASFTVDLRPARGLSVVTVDLHALVTVSNTYPPPAWLQTGAGDSTTPVPVHNPAAYTVRMEQDFDLIDADEDGIIDSFFFPARIKTIDVNGFIIWYPDYAGSDTVSRVTALGTEIIQQLPPIHWDVAADRWVFDASNDRFYDHYLADLIYDTEFDITNPPFFVRQRTTFGPWYRHWMISGSGGIFYDGPAPMPGEVQITLFKGVPKLDVTQYTSSPQYYRWTYTDIFPDRAGYSKLADVGLQVYSTSVSPTNSDIIVPPPELLGNISTMNDTPKLGTVCIPLSDKNGPWWQPA